MRVTKAKSRTGERKVDNEPVHTLLSFWFIVIGLSIMIFLRLWVLNPDRAFEDKWRNYALAQGILALIGLIGTQLSRQQKIFPRDFRRPELNTGIRTIITLAAVIFVETITQFTFTITTTEQALYWTFAAPCEESFFRLFIITLILVCAGNIMLKPIIIAIIIFMAILFKTLVGIDTVQFNIMFTVIVITMSLYIFVKDERLIKGIAVITSATMFAAFHVNYYSDLGKLIGVFFGGTIFAISFIYYKDITPCILAHFGINFIGTVQYLVML